MASLSKRERRIRDEKAKSLRDKGLSYPEIGKELGCSTGTAFNSVRRIIDHEIEELTEGREMRRRTQLGRYQRLYRHALEAKDWSAARQALVSIDKLFGLEAPKQIQTDVSVSTRVTPESLRQLGRSFLGDQKEDG